MKNKQSKTLDTKRLKTIGHKLHSIVTIADKGLNNNVVTETMRALKDHELVKITVRQADREEKARTIEALCKATDAELIQSIGHTALIFKANPEPNPKLSNILRFI